MYGRDSLEIILSHVSAGVMGGITNGSSPHYLNYLLEFLEAWEKRPAYLTPMAYRWCSAISEAAGRLGPSQILVNLPESLQDFLYNGVRPRSQDLTSHWVREAAETGFAGVRTYHGPVSLDAVSDYARERLQYLTPHFYPYILSITLEIGFHNVAPSRGQSALHLGHTSHHEWVFQTAFSSDDDEVIADTVCIWIVGRDRAPHDSCARYLAKRVETDTPFSPRLRWASTRTIEFTWLEKPEVFGLEDVRLLSRLSIDADDMVEKESWVQLLTEAIYSPTGRESLSPHYWDLLVKLALATKYSPFLAPRDTEVMRSLEGAEEWEKLGVWMVVVWSSLPFSRIPESESMESIEEVTRKSLLRRPSARQALEDLYEVGSLNHSGSAHRELKDRLQRICDQARAERFESIPSP